jgi:hypothetical protein
MTIGASPIDEVGIFVDGRHSSTEVLDDRASRWHPPIADAAQLLDAIELAGPVVPGP